MSRLPNSPRLNKLSPAGLASEVEALLRDHLGKLGAKELPDASRQFCGVVERATRWAQSGEGGSAGDAREMSAALELSRTILDLLGAPLGQAPALPLDPDRIEDGTIGRLAVVQLAARARDKIARPDDLLSLGEIAALASLSARQVRLILRPYQDEQGQVSALRARSYLAALRVPGVEDP